ncbi:sigma-70 family RNA polymerase sigma factor [Flammeovirga kamogawensis]|uniref:Sigma-70 family RNA polymerase sigma factor n=2 Tax=Flammeovirga kamogawensis TaxID=373891 RepID=A0ABX8GV77_9BACT|nr:sigma-70 family RNA polymerase sigma factor [Flammeovirga kamogawensis]QWG07057.1 sigma-70 family RNA polymerase sigma factor [Flammeovirga kamogawensis]
METELISVWNEMNDRLINFVKGKTQDEELSKDIVQEVFLKVFSKIDTLKDKNKLVSWIYQITRNEIVSHFRQYKFDMPSDDFFQEKEFEKEDLNSEVIEYMHPMIDTLPPKYRDALILSDIEKVPQKELAERLQISYSGAKSRVQRGRQMLRATYDKCCNITTDIYGDVLECKPKKCDDTCD